MIMANRNREMFISSPENISKIFADKMRGKVDKSICNIWTKMKFEPSLENLN